MTKGTKKMSFGKTTGQQSATVKKGGNEMGGRRKGPPAPNMLNPKRGHMSGRALVPSRAAEAALRANPSGIEAQDWKTRHFGDVCLLRHPEAESLIERPEPKDKDAKPDEPVMELVEVPANNLLAYLDKGFTHATPEPEEDEDPEPEADFDPNITRNLRGPLTRGAVVGAEREAAEIEAKNAEVVARKSKGAVAEKEEPAQRGTRFNAKKDE